MLAVSLSRVKYTLSNRSFTAPEVTERSVKTCHPPAAAVHCWIDVQRPRYRLNLTTPDNDIRRVNRLKEKLRLLWMPKPSLVRSISAWKVRLPVIHYNYCWIRLTLSPCRFVAGDIVAAHNHSAGDQHLSYISNPRSIYWRRKLPGFSYSQTRQSLQLSVYIHRSKPISSEAMQPWGNPH